MGGLAGYGVTAGWKYDPIKIPEAGPMVGDAAKRFLAVYLAATAGAVAFNLLLTPVYHDGSPEYPVWRILNWFMAAGVAVSLVVSILRRLALKKENSDVLDYLRTSLTFYGAIALAMLFFWEWFWTLNPDSETGDAVTSHIVYFPIVDALFVVVALATARHLWNDGGQKI